MNYCPNCGGELKSGLKYCPSCGCMLESGAAPLPEKEIFPESANSGSADNVFENFGGSPSETKESASQNSSSDRNPAYGASQNSSSDRDPAYGASDPSSSGTYSYTSPEPAAVPSTNGFAIAALILGIIALVFDFLLFIPSILAIIFGILGLKNSEQCGSGRGMSIAGIVMGILGFAFYLILILLAFVFSGVLLSL